MNAKMRWILWLVQGKGEAQTCTETFGSTFHRNSQWSAASPIYHLTHIISYLLSRVHYLYSNFSYLPQQLILTWVGLGTHLFTHSLNPQGSLILAKPHHFFAAFNNFLVLLFKWNFILFSQLCCKFLEYIPVICSGALDSSFSLYFYYKVLQNCYGEMGLNSRIG